MKFYRKLIAPPEAHQDVKELISAWNNFAIAANLHGEKLPDEWFMAKESSGIDFFR